MLTKLYAGANDIRQVADVLFIEFVTGGCKLSLTMPVYDSASKTNQKPN